MRCRLSAWVAGLRAVVGVGIVMAAASNAAAQAGVTYQTEVAFAGITFNQPVGFATPPNETDRLFVLEKPGVIQVINNPSGTPTKQVFLDLSARTNSDSEGGVLGLAFHPNFANNRFFYVFYTTNATTDAGTGLHDRVSRFTALASATNADILATERILISQYDEAGNHNGGDIHFGPDGYLYIALGDEGGGNDQYNNSQRIDRDFFSGILRIDVDQKAGNLVPNTHASVSPATYSVPADNPFVGAATFNGAAVVPSAVRTEFWAVGLRNPWRFSFDAPTGRLFAGDVGQSAREEIDLITKGANYGWSYREGLIAGPRSSPPAGASFTDPIWDADRNTAGSITGGVVYRGSRFPAIAGKYIFGDYVRNSLFAMTLPASGPVQVSTLMTVNSPVAFGADPRNGDILIASVGTGAVLRLVVFSLPAFTTQPGAQSVTAGQDAVFSAAVSDGTLRWQVSADNGATWTNLSDGAGYAGTTTATLTVKAASAALNNNLYRLVATNTTGSINSSQVRLTVTAVVVTAPVITAQPVPQTITAGHDGSFSAAGSGNSGRWQVSTDNGTTWTNLADNSTHSGTATSTLTITGATAALNGQSYRFVSSNGGGSTNSNSASLVVAPEIFPAPSGVAFDPAGFFYVTDSTTSTIHKVTDGTSAAVLAGASGQAGVTDGTGAAARFNQPGGLVVTPAGIIFLSDSANATIRRITAGGAVTTFAGLSTGRGNADGTGTAATFSSPQGIAVDASNNLYVADATNHTIRRISSDGQVTTFAGSAGNSGSTDGAATAARFNRPGAVALDATGNLYVADTFNNTIRRITSSGTVSTLAGVAGVGGSSDGTGAGALFNQPTGLALDATGNLYVADSGNNAIRRVSSGGQVTTLAGLPTIAGHQDATGFGAWFNHPRALAVDASGNVYVADTGNAAIRKITSAGVVTTLALVAVAAPTPTPDPTPTPTPTPPTNPSTPPASSGGGGGGAVSPWFLAALGSLMALRRMRRA